MRVIQPIDIDLLEEIRDREEQSRMDGSWEQPPESDREALLDEVDRLTGALDLMIKKYQAADSELFPAREVIGDLYDVTVGAA